MPSPGSGATVADVVDLLAQVHAVEASELPVSEFLDEDGSWRCTSCGACCQLVGPAVWTLLRMTIEPSDPSSRLACPQLDFQESGRPHCRVYDTRPLTCRAARSGMPAQHLAVYCARMKWVAEELGLELYRATDLELEGAPRVAPGEFDTEKWHEHMKQLGIEPVMGASQ